MAPAAFPPHPLCKLEGALARGPLSSSAALLPRVARLSGVAVAGPWSQALAVLAPFLLVSHLLSVRAEEGRGRFRQFCQQNWTRGW